MRRTRQGEPHLAELVARARATHVTPSEREAQIRSFAYGNVALENPRVTREMIERAADRTVPEK